MTELRDARLKRALQSAPDTSEAPRAATRNAVREAARRAVAKPAEAPWWRNRMPWNAAFATVLMAVLVGTLWHDKGVPDARPDMQAAPVPAPAPAPSAPPARKQAEVAKPKPAQPKAAPPPPEDAGAQSSSGPVVSELAKQQSADMAGARAPAPAAAPAAQLRAERSLLRDAAPPIAWTDMRIVAGTRTVLVPRSQAPELADAVDRLLASGRRADAPSSPADVRVELLRDGQPVTVLDPGPGRFGDERALQQVRGEVARLLAR